MKKRSAILLILLLPQIGLSHDHTEGEKIEFLIHEIENLEGADFIRNRSSHTPQQAAKHLRTKLRRAGRHIQTAEDFINICATRSSITGRVYHIRLPDGTTVESATFLRNLLDELENGPSG